jgi:hypothetical protein
VPLLPQGIDTRQFAIAWHFSDEGGKTATAQSNGENISILNNRYATEEERLRGLSAPAGRVVFADASAAPVIRGHVTALMAADIERDFTYHGRQY